MTKRIKLSTPWGLLGVLPLYFLFSQLYVKIVVPSFSFGGMIYNPRDETIVELTLLICTSFLLANKVKKPSDLYNWLYFIALLIPSAVLSAQQGNDRFFLLLMFASLWLVMFLRSMLSMVIPSLFSLIPSRMLTGVSKNYCYLPYYSVFAFVLLVLVFLMVSVHGSFNLNFSKVYEFRFDVSESMPTLLRYLMPLASGTLIGYLAALTCIRKNIFGLLLIVLLGVAFFGFSSHKSMLFNPLLAIAVYILFKVSRPHLVFLWGGTFLALLTLLLPAEYLKFLGSLFANRIVFIPSHINFFYFDYFSQNPLQLWADSKVSLGLVTSQLPMDAMHYIGGLMTSNFKISANTGWVANAYMNAGIVGIIIYASIIACIFSLIDFWSEIYGKQFVGAAFIVPVFAVMMSADLLIVLLTIGLSVLLILFQAVTMWLQIPYINVPKQNKIHLINA